MENVLIALIAAIVPSVLAPAVMLLLKNRSDRKALEAAHVREDAREARLEAAQALVRADLAIVKKQSDGMLTKVAEMSEAVGVKKGEILERGKAQDTADTLARGQEQGRAAERESAGAAKGTVTVGDAAGERVADATERSADAAQRVANVAEEKK